MDLAEIRFIPKVFAKREEWRFAEKSSRPPSYESPLKLQRHLARLVTIWKQIVNTKIKIHCAVGIGGTFVCRLFQRLK
jgi:hypothetical protein